MLKLISQKLTLDLGDDHQNLLRISTALEF